MKFSKSTSRTWRVFFLIFQDNKHGAYLGLSPLPVTVTTRIITFLIGNPYKPSFVTVTGWGVDRKHIKQQLMKETWHRFRHPLVNKKKRLDKNPFLHGCPTTGRIPKTWLSSPRSQLQSPISLFIHHPSLMQELDSHLWKSQVSQHQSIGSLL